MITECEREFIKAKLNEVKDNEQIRLGLEAIEMDLDFDDRFKAGEADIQNGMIKICLAKFLTTSKCVLKNGCRSIRHELRHFWQRKHYRKHVEWWDNHYEFYNDLHDDSNEYKFCTIEIDAEEYAKGSSRQVFQLDKTPTELEEMMKYYYENRSSLSGQMSLEEHGRIINNYLGKKKKN